jgi:hypothetical protein
MAVAAAVRFLVLGAGSAGVGPRLRTHRQRGSPRRVWRPVQVPSSAGRPMHHAIRYDWPC